MLNNNLLVCLLTLNYKKLLPYNATECKQPALHGITNVSITCSGLCQFTYSITLISLSPIFALILGQIEGHFIALL